jgi:Rrf2 family protein
VRISTRTRYGTRLMVRLGLYYPTKSPVLLKDIAKEEEISEKYLSQIIIPLKAAGLVNSFRGAHGGYTLSRAPSQIKVGEIVEVLEGGLDVVSCTQRPSECARVSVCVTRNLWCKVNEKISHMLNSVTLQELVKQLKEKTGNNILYNI